MRDKHLKLSDYKDARLLQKSYETEDIFKRTKKNDIEKSAHKQHKYLKIENGKYIYDHSKMTSKDHFDAVELHDNKANQKTGLSLPSFEKYHKELKQEHEDLAYKKEGEERASIKSDKIKELKKILNNSQDEEEMINATNEINKLQKSEAFDMLIPKDFEDRIEKSKGPWKKGKHQIDLKSKEGSSLTSSFLKYENKKMSPVEDDANASYNMGRDHGLNHTGSDEFANALDKEKPRSRRHANEIARKAARGNSGLERSARKYLHKKYNLKPNPDGSD